MNHDDVLAVLPNSKEEAKSIKDIAPGGGDGLPRDERQKGEGHKFWYNAYWKTELAK